MSKMTEEEKELFEERVAIITIYGKMSESYARLKAWQQIDEFRKKKELEQVKDKGNDKITR